MSDCVVTIERDDRRIADFQAVFGVLSVPVLSPTPIATSLPGKPGVTAVYLLDLKAITAEQRLRLIEHLAARFALPRAEVEADLDRYGVPIVAAGTSLTIFNLQKWMG